MENRKDTGRKAGIGRIGEDLVCKYLMDRGHTILERNWRAGHLEIDIISMDRNGIHFVEVKSRFRPGDAAPEEKVDAAKRKRTAAAAARYLLTHDTGEQECFFDVAAVRLDGERTDIRYYPQAYMPLFT